MANFSVGSWSFHRLYETGQINLFSYLQTMKYRYATNTADIWTGMMASVDADYVAAVRRTLLREGMAVANLAVDEARIWDDQPEVREHQYQVALDYLRRIGPALGAKSIRIDMGIQTDTLTNQQFDAIAERYREYCRLAESEGMRVGPQNHYGPTMVPRTYLKMADAVASPAFGLVLDIGRWSADHAEGNALTAKLAFHTHFDNKTTGQALEDTIRLLRDAGYSGVWSLEHRSGVNEYEEVAYDLAGLRRAWARVNA